MPGKKNALTPEQIERARALVEDGYAVTDIAKRFGVSRWVLNSYGIKASEKSKRGTHARLPKA
jgi:hypothetical protein